MAVGGCRKCALDFDTERALLRHVRLHCPDLIYLKFDEDATVASPNCAFVGSCLAQSKSAKELKDEDKPRCKTKSHDCYPHDEVPKDQLFAVAKGTPSCSTPPKCAHQLSPVVDRNSFIGCGTMKPPLGNCADEVGRADCSRSCERNSVSPELVFRKQARKRKGKKSEGDVAIKSGERLDDHMPSSSGLSTSSNCNAITNGLTVAASSSYIDTLLEAAMLPKSMLLSQPGFSSRHRSLLPYAGQSQELGGSGKDMGHPLPATCFSLSDTLAALIRHPIGHFGARAGFNSNLKLDAAASAITSKLENVDHDKYSSSLLMSSCNVATISPTTMHSASDKNNETLLMDSLLKVPKMEPTSKMEVEIKQETDVVNMSGSGSIIEEFQSAIFGSSSSTPVEHKAAVIADDHTDNSRRPSSCSPLSQNNYLEDLFRSNVCPHPRTKRRCVNSAFSSPIYGQSRCFPGVNVNSVSDVRSCSEKKE